jgi:hypothetical protein
MLKPGFRERFMRCVHKLDAGNVGKPLGQDVVSILNRRCVGFLNQRDVKVMPMTQRNLAYLLDSLKENKS